MSAPDARGEALLTVGEVEAEVRAIAKMVGDNEGAHSAEDGLWGRVLIAIAEDRCEDPRGCARAALTTENLEFTRWYA